MISWFKKLAFIVNNFDQIQADINQRINSVEYVSTQARDFVKSATEVNADVHIRGDNKIIMIGRFRGNDFIQTYELHNKDFNHFVEVFRDLAKSHRVNRIDAPPAMRCAFEREDFF